VTGAAPGASPARRGPASGVISTRSTRFPTEAVTAPTSRRHPGARRPGLVLAPVPCLLLSVVLLAGPTGGGALPSELRGAPPIAALQAANTTPLTVVARLAALTYSQGSCGTLPAHATFIVNASGGTPPYDFDWLLGDGANSTGTHFTHMYRAAGNYTAVVFVNDSANASAKYAVPVSVANSVPCPSPLSGGNLLSQLRSFVLSRDGEFLLGLLAFIVIIAVAAAASRRSRRRRAASRPPPKPVAPARPAAGLAATRTTPGPSAPTPATTSPAASKSPAPTKSPPPASGGTAPKPPT
jgi:PKD repeat protein